MLYSVRLYLRDKWILSAVSLASIFLISSLWYALAYIHPTSEPIFLHYNSIFGIDLVGEWWKIFVLPFIGLTVFLINLAIAWRLFGAERLVARSLLVSTAVFELILFLEVIFVVRLNS